MKSVILIALLRGLAVLPLGAARRLGAALGRSSWALSSRMARTTRINLALAFPAMTESERTLLGKRSISHTFQTITESGPAWLWPPAKVLDRVLAVEGLGLLQEAVAAGKGVVVIAPHLGNWEVFGLYLNNCGCGASSQLYQAPRDERLGRLIYQARSRGGANMVATDNKGVISLLKTLKSGKIVGILPDQVPPESGGDFAPFFGRPALTMTLVSRLIQKTGARAVVGFAMRETVAGRQGWKVVFQAADPDIYAEHISTSLAGLNRSIEQAVVLCPEQYQWEYKRYKRVPAGATRPY